MVFVKSTDGVCEVSRWCLQSQQKVLVKSTDGACKVNRWCLWSQQMVFVKEGHTEFTPQPGWTSFTDRGCNLARLLRLTCIICGGTAPIGLSVGIPGIPGGNGGRCSLYGIIPGGGSLGPPAGPPGPEVCINYAQLKSMLTIHDTWQFDLRIKKSCYLN